MMGACVYWDAIVIDHAELSKSSIQTHCKEETRARCLQDDPVEVVPSTDRFETVDSGEAWAWAGAYWQPYPTMLDKKSGKRVFAHIQHACVRECS